MKNIKNEKENNEQGKTEVKYFNYEKPFKFENGASINELTIA